MPFLMVRNDITNVHADAIVNPANEELLEGSGTSRAIYLAAGEEKLTEACAQIGFCRLGEAVVTEAFNLDAKVIVHAVVPEWDDGYSNEEQILYDAYSNSMRIALQSGCESIAFPLLSSGNLGFPKEVAMKTAIAAISDFLMEYEMMVYLVLYDRNSVAVSERVMGSIDAYIDDHYVDSKDEVLEGDQGFKALIRRGLELRRKHRQRSENEKAEESEDLFEGVAYDASAALSDAEEKQESDSFPQMFSQIPMQQPYTATAPSAPSASVPQKASAKQGVKPKRSLDSLMNNLDETFSEMLLRLIDERGLKDSEVYKKANVDRRHFSKIRNNMDYTPNKKTVISFAIALELTLDETVDLLARAGYAFSKSSKFDVIICFFLENQSYNIFEINEILFAYGQQTLCE